MSLVAFASELVAAVPAGTSVKEQATGSDSLFAEVLMDAEIAAPEEDAAVGGVPLITTASVKTTTPEKAGLSFWGMGMRPLSAEAFPAPAADEPTDDLASAQAVTVVVVPVPNTPPPAPPLSFALPSFEAVPVVDQGTATSESPEPEQAFSVPGKSALAPSGLQVPSSFEIAASGKRQEESVSDVEAAPDEKDENGDDEFTQSTAEATTPVRIEPAGHPAMPLRISDTPVPSQPSAELSRVPMNSEPPRMTMNSAPSANSSPVTDSGDGTSTQQRPIPERIAMDALIRPEKEPAAEPAPPAESMPIRPAAAASSMGGQGFTDTSSEEGSREPEINMALPAAQRHSAVDYAMPSRDVISAERPAGESSSPMLQQTPSSARPYIEPKEAPTGPSAPLKSMEMRIPDAQSDVVIQVQERKGEIQVTVRTDDARTANDIATNLPELTRSLGQQGFRTETDFSKQSDADHGQDSPSRRDWEAEPDQRRKRAPQEDFEEYLW